MILSITHEKLAASCIRAAEGSRHFISRSRRRSWLFTFLKPNLAVMVTPKANKQRPLSLSNLTVDDQLHTFFLIHCSTRQHYLTERQVYLPAFSEWYSVNLMRVSVVDTNPAKILVFV